MVCMPSTAPSWMRLASRERRRGRTQEEILAAARERIGNDEHTEREIVTGELGRIALLRLERLLDALG